jgi:hypothetical protein
MRMTGRFDAVLQMGAYTRINMERILNAALNISVTRNRPDVAHHIVELVYNTANGRLFTCQYIYTQIKGNRLME